jgi:hypothetical protein
MPRTAMACSARMKAAMKASTATRCLIGQVLPESKPPPGWALRCRLLNHLIWSLQERLGDRQAESLGGCDVRLDGLIPTGPPGTGR